MAESTKRVRCTRLKVSIVADISFAIAQESLKETPGLAGRFVLDARFVLDVR